MSENLSVLIFPVVFILPIIILSLLIKEIFQRKCFSGEYKGSTILLRVLLVILSLLVIFVPAFMVFTVNRESPLLFVGAVVFFIPSFFYGMFLFFAGALSGRERFLNIVRYIYETPKGLDFW